MVVPFLNISNSKGLPFDLFTNFFNSSKVKILIPLTDNIKSPGNKPALDAGDKGSILFINGKNKLGIINLKTSSFLLIKKLVSFL